MSLKLSSFGFSHRSEYKYVSPKRQNILINLDVVIYINIIWDIFLVSAEPET
jgi:hypothetical protein